MPVHHFTDKTEATTGTGMEFKYYYCDPDNIMANLGEVTGEGAG